jgi:hypothetical protein
MIIAICFAVIKDKVGIVRKNFFNPKIRWFSLKTGGFIKAKDSVFDCGIKDKVGRHSQE